jgi:energy-coupling factor transporter ATP-binding protein EcfA2
VLLGSQESSQTIFLGKLAEVPLNEVWLDTEREHVIVIVGKRGSGKSYTLGSIVEGFCSNTDGIISQGVSSRAVVLFDTLDIFWPSLYPVGPSEAEEVERQMEGLKKWKIDAVPLEVSIWVPSGYRTTVMPKEFHDLRLDHVDMHAEDWASLFRIDLIRDPMGQLLSEIYDLASKNGGPSLSQMLEVIKAEDVEQHYSPETIRAIRQRLRAYSRYPVFSGGTLLNDIIKPGRLSVILLNGLPDDLRAVIVSVLVRKILRERSLCSMATKSLQLRPDIDDKEKTALEKVVRSGIPRVTIAIDEAQNALPRNRKTTATDLLVKLVREGRNFGTSLMVTTQQPGAIDPRVMAQADVMVFHKLVMQGDIDVAMKHMKSKLPTEIKRGYDDLSLDELMRVLDVGQCFISSNESSLASNRALVVNIRPRVSRHGGFDD